MRDVAGHAWWRTALIVCGVYAIVSVFFAGHVWLEYAYAGRRISGVRALALSSAEWFLWAALTPAVVWLARRFRIGRGRLVRGLAVHVPVSIVLTVATLIAGSACAALVTGQARLVLNTPLKMYLTHLTYWAIVGIAYSIEQFRAARDREIRASRLQAALARAEVDVLRARLQPHFLFNTLNTIAGLMREDIEAADAMLARLSDLLRLTLESADVPEVPLRRELELVERYLEIQQMRYGPRLTVRVDAPPDTLDVLVPTLMLQPLAENAIQHGIAAIPGPGILEIEAARHGTRLSVEVRDNGAGPSSVQTVGRGLQNTRARLRALHGDGASVSLARAEGGGTVARIELPAVMPPAVETR